jgi:hypothetical protein
MSDTVGWLDALSVSTHRQGWAACTAATHKARPCEQGELAFCKGSFSPTLQGCMPVLARPSPVDCRNHHYPVTTVVCVVRTTHEHVDTITTAWLFCARARCGYCAEAEPQVAPRSVCAELRLIQSVRHSQVDVPMHGLAVIALGRFAGSTPCSDC